MQLTQVLLALTLVALTHGMPSMGPSLGPVGPQAAPVPSDEVATMMLRMMAYITGVVPQGPWGAPVLPQPLPQQAFQMQAAPATTDRPRVQPSVAPGYGSANGSMGQTAKPAPVLYDLTQPTQANASQPAPGLPAQAVNTTGQDMQDSGAQHANQGPTFIRRGRGAREELTETLRDARYLRAREKTSYKKHRNLAEWLCEKCCSTNWQESHRCRSCNGWEPGCVPLLPGSDPLWQNWMSWAECNDIIAQHNQGRARRGHRHSGADDANDQGDQPQQVQPWTQSQDPHASGSASVPPHMAMGGGHGLPCAQGLQHVPRPQGPSMHAPVRPSRAPSRSQRPRSSRASRMRRRHRSRSPPRRPRPSQDHQRRRTAGQGYHVHLHLQE